VSDWKIGVSPLWEVWTVIFSPFDFERSGEFDGSRQTKQCLFAEFDAETTLSYGELGLPKEAREVLGTFIKNTVPAGVVFTRARRLSRLRNFTSTFLMVDQVLEARVQGEHSRCS